MISPQDVSALKTLLRKLFPNLDFRIEQEQGQESESPLPSPEKEEASPQTIVEYLSPKFCTKEELLASVIKKPVMDYALANAVEKSLKSIYGCIASTHALGKTNITLSRGRDLDLQAEIAALMRAKGFKVRLDPTSMTISWGTDNI